MKRVLFLVLCLALTGCGRPRPQYVQGYVEAEFIYVSPPLSGALEELAVQRGDQVKQGDLLFQLENKAEIARRDEAVKRVAEAKAKLEDVKKAGREPEIAAKQEQLSQARAALNLAEIEFQRQTQLVNSGAGSARDLDVARSNRDQNNHLVSQLEADLKLVNLAAREDQIVSAEANLNAVTAALDRAQWDVDQKRQAAPAGGLINDTLFRQGEWVPAGQPIVNLLPPENIKVRTFVPQPMLSKIQVGDTATVRVDGREPLTGKVSFISPRAEFTPPVIYSQESRSKLVFMLELRFEPAIAATLHPGQPVDISFQPDSR